MDGNRMGRMETIRKEMAHMKDESTEIIEENYEMQLKRSSEMKMKIIECEKPKKEMRKKIEWEEWNNN